MVVEFNDDAPIAPTRPRESRDSFLSRLMMKTGFIKSAQQAQIAMLILAVLLLLGAWFLSMSTAETLPAPLPAGNAL